MDNDMIKVGITHGDYNGIGYEVILKMLDDPRMLELCTPVIYGSAKIAAFYRKGMELQQPQQLCQIADAADAKAGACNIVNVIGEDARIEPGQSTKEAGQAAFAALERAVADLRDGKIDALVTAPINKHNIQSELFHFPGHTEYLEASAADGSKALMILCDESVRVALVTTHLPLAKISEAITKDAVLEKLRLFDQSLVKDFGVHKPRIAVLALNPHSGDNGLIGTEEQEVIIPAIEQAQKEKIHAFGPYAADGFFGSGLFKRFDGVLAMYHDQGLAPFKAIAMDNGVNFTAGLPWVRTSPDHGTGYDIAGADKASEASMRSALYMALDVLRHRRNHAEATENPLKPQTPDKPSRGGGGADGADRKQRSDRKPKPGKDAKDSKETREPKENREPKEAPAQERTAETPAPAPEAPAPAAEPRTAPAETPKTADSQPAAETAKQDNPE